MLKQVVESLKQGQEIEPEPRKYLIDLLSKWHEGCTVSFDDYMVFRAKEIV